MKDHRGSVCTRPKKLRKKKSGLNGIQNMNDLRGTDAVLLPHMTAKAAEIQSTPDNSNLQGESKQVRVIGSSKKIARSKEKNSFYCTVSILITFNCKNVELKLKDTVRL